MKKVIFNAINQVIRIVQTQPWIEYVGPICHHNSQKCCGCDVSVNNWLILLIYGAPPQKWIRLIPSVILSFLSFIIQVLYHFIAPLWLLIQLQMNLCYNVSKCQGLKSCNNFWNSNRFLSFLFNLEKRQHSVANFCEFCYFMIFTLFKSDVNAW